MPHQCLHTSGQLSTLSQHFEYRVTQNTEALKSRTLGQPPTCFSLEEYPCLVVLCHTRTSLKLPSKFLIYGNILLNFSAAFIPRALGWVFVVLVFPLHTGRNKEQYLIWSNTFGFFSERKQQDSSLTQPHTARAPGHSLQLCETPLTPKSATTPLNPHWGTV